MKRNPTPVYLLSGFLGSGKTTLLKRWLEAAEAGGRKPAVVMNELGEVNFDGIELGDDVRMAEMLGGCICCTVRGDLGTELLKLIQDHDPDMILIESTGAANPLEIIDAVTDASMLERVELRRIVTVVDAGHLQEWARKGKGSTYRLMKEQISCASVILLNKTDLLPEADTAEMERLVREWNGYAPIYRTVGAVIRIGLLEGPAEGGSAANHGSVLAASDETGSSCNCGGEAHDHGHDHAHEHDHSECSEPSHHPEHHHTHEHVMAYTHYFEGPIDSERFEAMMGRLPDGVYRAKGILTFTDTASRFMFQYAYKQLDLMKIMPQGVVPDVAVFIGEHFDKAKLELDIRALSES
ncbi:GTP-binding protein [Paenibacillus sp. GYB004]|uniref:CobW family GTP-binding protein n=1 Tax=Paenibacillus sp. GYB004 TaxID=2994393 RepID=UPI002F96AD4C